MPASSAVPLFSHKNNSLQLAGALGYGQVASVYIPVTLLQLLFIGSSDQKRAPVTWLPTAGGVTGFAECCATGGETM